MGSTTTDAQVDALEAGRAFARLPGRRLIAVRGGDAERWLHDLVTADVAGLRQGAMRRSLLLTPTGRIRADLHVARLDGGFLLVQGPDQPDAVDAMLAPYVLSSEVVLEDVTGDLTIVAVLGQVPEDGWAAPGVTVLAPSPLGDGVAALVAAGEPAATLAATLATAGLEEVGPDALERWRILRGIPRMGTDFGTDALPAEAGLEAAIDFTKGCFLGQESVARVRNLGHPPRAVVPVRSRTRLAVGAPVLAGAEVVGEVTSAVDLPEGSAAIARVRWAALGTSLATETGSLTLR